MDSNWIVCANAYETHKALAVPADFAEPVLALHQACEAAISARGEHDSDCDVQQLRAYAYAVAGKSWCPAVTEIVQRLTGKVPLCMMRSALINADRYYQRAVEEPDSVSFVRMAPIPRLR